MSRPVRIEFPGAHYHVTSKGTQDGSVFLDNEDRLAFLNVLETVVSRFAWLLHCYVLMDSHYHIIVECPKANLSKGMRQLNGVYTQHFNRRHEEEGSLFKGRFKSVLFEAKTYLLPLSRHVVLNPVRLGVSSSAQTYRWSSHRVLGGAIKQPNFLHIDTLLGSFEGSLKEKQSQYKEYVKAGVHLDSPLLEKSSQVLLGSAKFIGQMQPILDGEKLAKRGPVRALRRRSLPVLFKKVSAMSKSERNGLIKRAHIDHAYTLMEIGDHLGLHYTTVSKVVNQ
ncbi:MAG: putative transposase [Candidatus Azotimanducaceae bacterium]|jgi:putative transposase